MYILSFGDIIYFAYLFETQKEVIMYAYKVLLKQITNVLKVDILAKFQRPFIALQLDDIK